MSGTHCEFRADDGGMLWNVSRAHGLGWTAEPKAVARAGWESVTGLTPDEAGAGVEGGDRKRK